MTKYEELYHQIADDMHDVQKGKMFGALCIKAPNGKAGVMFWRDDMIFKLGKEREVEALQLAGAKIFEPMGGRQMAGWVHVPNEHAERWKGYAEIAMDNVRKIELVKKPAKKTSK
jgi:hypothetical protein